MGFRQPETCPSLSEAKTGLAVRLIQRVMIPANERSVKPIFNCTIYSAGAGTHGRYCFSALLIRKGRQFYQRRGRGLTVFPGAATACRFATGSSLQAEKWKTSWHRSGKRFAGFDQKQLPKCAPLSGLTQSVG